MNKIMWLVAVPNAKSERLCSTPLTVQIPLCTHPLATAVMATTSDNNRKPMYIIDLYWIPAKRVGETDDLKLIGNNNASVLSPTKLQDTIVWWLISRCKYR